jgi:hypothetical protein
MLFTFYFIILWLGYPHKTYVSQSIFKFYILIICLQGYKEIRTSCPGCYSFGNNLIKQ